MFATFLITLREVLEASLIIGIVLAAARGVVGRVRWVGTGIAAGLLGAVLVATSADGIASALEGIGQEVFNAGVLFIAVIMLGWHNVWMKQHGRELAAHVGGISRAVADGSRPLYALAVVVGAAILREGSEVVLFLHGIVAAQGTSTWVLLLGGLGGVAVGGLIGAAMYQGLLRLPTRHLFTVTSWLILLLAAGMAAQGARWLVQAGLVPSLGSAIWNTTSILSEQSLTGQVLQILVGYMARPDGIQVLAYLLTLLMIGGAMLLVDRRVKQQVHKGLGRTAVFALATSGAVLLCAKPNDAYATLNVYSPIVEQGELELEVRGQFLVDDNDDVDGAHQEKYEIGYGFTDWWFSSLSVEAEDEPSDNYGYEAAAWENIFQVTEQGKYWIDAGLYTEYEVPDGSGPDKLEVKLLLEKSLPHWTHTCNLIVEREVGGGADKDLEAGYAWRSMYRLNPWLQPAIELYGDLGSTGNFGIHDDESHLAGPVILGNLSLSRNVSLSYEIGYLFGLTDESTNGTIKWLLELEIPL
jgi:high-affinity iron transporter